MMECGDTSVLVTATRSSGREGIDFLPLICDYEERLYAAGRIPGSYMRREARPPERATLIARLIDRPMRPLFPSWMRDDLQVVATCLSLDERVPADVLAVTGASMATLLAGIPFQGPMAAVRVGLLGDDFVLNPSYREIERGDLDLVVAGTPSGVVMVEAGADVAGSFLSRNLVDELIVYMAPDVLGSDGRGMFIMPEIRRITDRHSFKIDDVRQFGRDLRIVFQNTSKT